MLVSSLKLSKLPVPLVTSNLLNKLLSNASNAARFCIFSDY